MPWIEDRTVDNINGLRLDGMNGAMEMLLSMPNSPGNIIPAARTLTRESSNAMMRHYMKRAKVDASTLSVVHVAGTKGKGSTCAFTESILRAHGAKTGMFTSPHLILPNERLRINGKPIEEKLFASTFWTIWDNLEKSKISHAEYPVIPNYFTLLTLMAISLFVNERVDVAILEVGLGGRHDATNAIEKPVVCGITALDYDHTRILGSTLDKIAYEKAGILKANVPAFTIQQEPLPAEVLQKCARDESTELVVVPQLFESSDLAGSLSMHGQYQLVNASLAATLASCWLAQTRGLQMPPLNELLTPTIIRGLQIASWPGRAQTIIDLHGCKATFHLDGAHTPLSVDCCSTWFKSCCNESTLFRILVFNCHHERNFVQLVKSLVEIPFDLVIFCPTGVARPSNRKVPSIEEMFVNAKVDTSGMLLDEFKLSTDETQPNTYWQQVCKKAWTTLKKLRSEKSEAIVLPSMSDALQYIREISNENSRVLVTGSLYTVGDAIQQLGWKETHAHHNM